LTRTNAALPDGVACAAIAHGASHARPAKNVVLPDRRSITSELSENVPRKEMR
jgi:hypothetical protein